MALGSSSHSLIARTFRVSGRVQGVGFRYYVQHWAVELDIKGFVRNTPEDAVECYAIGTESQMERFKERLSKGPRMAFIERVDEFSESVDPELKSFQITY
jgi:acylphosphatase